MKWKIKSLIPAITAGFMMVGMLGMRSFATETKYNIQLLYNDGVTEDETVQISNSSELPIPTYPPEGYVFDNWYVVNSEIEIGTKNINSFTNPNSTYSWTVDSDGVWSSGNTGKSFSTSNMISEEFTPDGGTLSFEWKSYGESNWDYLGYDILNVDTGQYLSDQTTPTYQSCLENLKGKSSSSFTTVTKNLESGTYRLLFMYGKDSSGDYYDDKGYVKNIKISGAKIITLTPTNDLRPDSFDEDAILIAKWKPITYKIHFDANGGSGEMSEQLLTYDQAENLKYNNFTNDTEFAYWSTAEDGTGKTFLDGSSIKNLSSTNNDEIVLYAQWKSADDKTFAVYSDSDNSLNFYKRKVVPIAGSVYNGKTATAVYEGFDSTSYNAYSLAPWDSVRESITNVEIVDEGIKPVSTAYWFYYFQNCTDFIGLNKLDTSEVTNMSYMFDHAGSNVSNFELNLSNWDVGNVTDMSWMFSGSGYYSELFELDLSNWNTSNVTNVSYMFYYAGWKSTLFNLNSSNWDTSSITNMNSMFFNAGYNATSWNVAWIDNWDVSNVTNMGYMFFGSGHSASNFELNLSDWNTGKVTNMGWMFYETCGNSYSDFKLDLSDWDVSQVTDMGNMFYQAGFYAPNFELDLSDWDVSQVTNMYSMFCKTGYSSITWTIGDLSNWNTEKVTNMSYMFNRAGYSATNWSIGDLSNWSVSNVTNMSYMFENAGYSSTTWTIGNLSNWNTKKVTNMSYMFNNAGRSDSDFELDLSGWDISNVTNISYMFSNTGANIIKTPKNISSSISKTNILSRNYIDKTDNDKKYTGSSFPVGNGEISHTLEISETPFAIYSADDNSLSFYNSIDFPTDNSTYNGKTATKIYREFDTTTYTYSSSVPWYSSYSGSIKKVEIVDEGIKPVSTNYWFYYFSNCSDFIGLNKLDISETTNMKYTFYYAGYNVPDFELDLSEWNAYNVIDMSYMFYNIGASSIKTPKNINSTVTKTSILYKTYYDKTDNDKEYAGSDFPVGNGEVSHTLELKPVAFAIYSADDNSFSLYKRKIIPTNGSTYNGKTATKVYTGFDTTTYTNSSSVPWSSYSYYVQKVEIMEEGIKPVSTAYWFRDFTKCSEFIGLDKIDTSEVTNMKETFAIAGRDTANFELDLSGWDTSNVTDMSYMFYYAGEDATTWSIGDVSNWNVENVTDMSNMFYYTGIDAVDFELNLSNWDASNVTNMSYMFYNSGVDNIKTPKNISSNVDTYCILPFTTYYDKTDNWTEYYGSRFPVGNGEVSHTLMNEIKYTFAIYSTDDNSLSFYNENVIPTAGSTYNGKTATEVYTSFDTTAYTSGSSVPWYSYRSSISKVEVIDKGIEPTSTAYWFSDFNSCNEIDVNKLDMSKVENMECMFYNIGSEENLIELDLSRWNTTNVKNANDLFAGSYITKLDISNIEFGENIINANNVFGDDYNCMCYLEEITVGDKFVFGNGEIVGPNGESGVYIVILPCPSEEYIEGTTGYWYNKETLEAFDVIDVPNKTAATYVAYVPYTISYDANGGEGTIDSQLVYMGHNYNLNSASTLNKEEHKFTEWNTESDGSGISYMDEEEVSDLATSYDQNVILYAQWKYVEPTNEAAYTVQHWLQNVNGDASIKDENNYTLADSEEFTGIIGESVSPFVKIYNGYVHPEIQTVTILEDGSLVVNYYYERLQGKSEFDPRPSREGYTFGGWYEDDDFAGVELTDKSEKPTGQSHYIKWLKNAVPYKVRHYTLKLNGNENNKEDYELKEVESLFAPVEERVVLNGNDYEGFTAKTSDEIIISANGLGKYNIYYTRNEYTVTINSNESIDYVIGDGTYQYGETVTIKAVVKDGHVWDGWTGDISSLEQEYTFEMPANNITIYANGKYPIYNITYNLNGGVIQDGSDEEYSVTNAVTLPVPVKEGYTFGGWYDNSEFYGNSITTTAGMSGDKAFYAKWDINSYTATFDANGGSAASPATITKDYNSAIGTLPTTNRTGYTFDGWYTAKTGGTKITTDTKVTANVTYYAQWTVNEYTYNIVYTSNSGTQLGTATAKYAYGTTNEIVAKDFNGYTKPANQSVVWDNVNAKTITFTYTPIEYNVTIDCVGGSGVTNSKYTIETATFTLGTPSRTGYTFTGWTGSNGSTPQTSVSIANGSTGNKTYTANWSINSYTATFDANGGSAANHATIVRDYNTSLGTLPTISRTGYTFNGWYTMSDGGTQITSDTKVTSDVTYYAQWTAIECIYDIIHKSNSGVQLDSEKIKYEYGTTNIVYPKDFNGYRNPESKTIEWDGALTKTVVFTYDPIEYEFIMDYKDGTNIIDSVYTIESAINLPVEIERNGYIFIGWTGSNGEIPQKNVSIEKGSTGNKNYNANWNAIEYSIKYNLNGGTNIDNIVDKYTIADEIILPIPTKNNFKFDGWYESIDFVGSAISIIEKGSSGDKEFYAKWEPKNVNLRYLANGGTFDKSKYIVKHYTENLDNNEYSLKEVESLSGIANTDIVPETKAYEGFLSPDKQSVKIKGDGSLVVEYYYTRNSYTVTLSKGTGIDTVSGDGNYKYGETVTISATVLSGYEWLEWTGSFETEMQEYTFTMPAENVTIMGNAGSPRIFAIYSLTDNSLSFYNRTRVPNVGSTYENKAVTAVYTGLENTLFLPLNISGEDYTLFPAWYRYRTNIKRVDVIDEISPKNLATWFYEFKNCETWNLSKLNTSNVTSMSYMFDKAGYNAATFNIPAVSNWDVSKVTNMAFMFREAGYNATSFNIGTLSEWDVSNVTNMACMFDSAGYSATSFVLDLSKWDVSNVTNMSNMFESAGYSSNVLAWSLGDISGWNTSKVTDMCYMFYDAGYKAVWHMDLSKWDVSSVETYYPFNEGNEYVNKITMPNFK